MIRQITCINKPSPYIRAHEAITHYGYRDAATGQTGIATREEMVVWAKQQGNQAFVEDKYGNKAYCYVNRKGLVEFLQTYRDGVWTDNLLSLDECPLPTR